MSPSLVHLHIHFSLTLGFDYNKDVILPINELYLKNRIKHKYVYLPTRENEFIVLVIRLILKNGLLQFLLSSPMNQFKWISRRNNEVIKAKDLLEFQILLKQINYKKIEENLIKQNIIELDLFNKMIDVIRQNDSYTLFFKTCFALRIRLRNIRAITEKAPMNMINSFIRINWMRLNTLFKNDIIFKKQIINGGRIIAFIGGDGAGKSTNIQSLQKRLSRHFSTKSLHIGRPKYSTKGYFARIFAILVKPLGLSDLSLALNYVSLALNRRATYKKAIKLKNKGHIVLLDRFSIKNLKTMDCPRIKGIYPNRFKYLSRLEIKCHDSINKADCVIVLKLDPQIAIKRRPEDEPEELRRRSGSIWNFDFSNMDKFIQIDSSQSISKVEKDIFKVIWNIFLEKETFFEVIGLAGSGKTTVTNYIKKEKPDFFKYDYNSFLSTLKNACYNIYWCCYIIIKTKEIMYVKTFLHLLNFYTHLRNSKTTKTNFFDQGPIFMSVILIKEAPSLRKKIFNELKKHAIYFDRIFLLNAPIEILVTRIRKRTQKHRAKNLSDKELGDFLNDYSFRINEVLEIIKNNGSIVENINSGNNNPELVCKKIMNHLNNY